MYRNRLKHSKVSSGYRPTQIRQHDFFGKYKVVMHRLPGSLNNVKRNLRTAAENRIIELDADVITTAKNK